MSIDYAFFYSKLKILKNFDLKKYNFFFLVLKGNKTVAQQVPLSKLQVNQFLLSFDLLIHWNTFISEKVSSE